MNKMTNEEIELIKKTIEFFEKHDKVTEKTPRISSNLLGGMMNRLSDISTPNIRYYFDKEESE